jgi:hypothetical protein
VPAAARRPNLLVGLVWIGCLAGAVLSMIALAHRPAPASPGDQIVAAQRPSAPGAVGQRLTTSFGSMSVDYVVRLVGDRKPMGVTVGRGEMAIQLGVTLTNVERRALRFSPTMFQLPGAARGAVDVGRLPGDAVPARRAHRFVVRYAVPATAALGSLRFRDPGRAAPVVVPLGRRDAMGRLDVTTHDFSPTAITP